MTTTNVVPERPCLDCGTKLVASTDNFYRDSSKRGGLGIYCKVCCAKQGRAYRVRNREKIREKRRREKAKLRVVARHGWQAVAVLPEVLDLLQSIDDICEVQNIGMPGVWEMCERLRAIIAATTPRGSA